MSYLLPLLMFCLFVVFDVKADVIVPDGTLSHPLYVNLLNLSSSMTASTAISKKPFSFSSISSNSANQYTLLVAAGSCSNGGMITATHQAASVGLLYVDETKGVSNGGTTLGIGAIPLGGAQSSNEPGMTVKISATPDAVYVYGPIGASFQGWCS